MMKLYLLRHGDALSEQVAPGRPLSPAGEQQGQIIAKFLANNSSVAIKDIVHSAKLRAQQTAEIVRNLAFPTANIQEHRGLLPNDDPEALLPYLQALPDNTMLVSHLPLLPLLCSMLTTDDINLLAVQFTTCSVLCLERTSARWQIMWMITPELLTGL